MQFLAMAVRSGAWYRHVPGARVLYKEEGM